MWKRFRPIVPMEPYAFTIFLFPLARCSLDRHRENDNKKPIAVRQNRSSIDTSYRGGKNGRRKGERMEIQPVRPDALRTRLSISLPRPTGHERV